MAPADAGRGGALSPLPHNSLSLHRDDTLGVSPRAQAAHPVLLSSLHYAANPSSSSPSPEPFPSPVPPRPSVGAGRASVSGPSSGALCSSTLSPVPSFVLAGSATSSPAIPPVSCAPSCLPPAYGFAVPPVSLSLSQLRSLFLPLASPMSRVFPRSQASGDVSPAPPAPVPFVSSSAPFSAPSSSPSPPSAPQSASAPSPSPPAAPRPKSNSGSLRYFPAFPVHRCRGVSLTSPTTGDKVCFGHFEEGAGILLVAPEVLDTLALSSRSPFFDGFILRQLSPKVFYDEVKRELSAYLAAAAKLGQQPAGLEGQHSQDKKAREKARWERAAGGDGEAERGGEPPRGRDPESEQDEQAEGLLGKELGRTPPREAAGGEDRRKSLGTSVPLQGKLRGAAASASPSVVVESLSGCLTSADEATPLLTELERTGKCSVPIQFLEFTRGKETDLNLCIGDCYWLGMKIPLQACNPFLVSRNEGILEYFTAPPSSQAPHPSTSWSQEAEDERRQRARGGRGEHAGRAPGRQPGAGRPMEEEDGQDDDELWDYRAALEEVSKHMLEKCKRAAEVLPETVSSVANKVQGSLPRSTDAALEKAKQCADSAQRSLGRLAEHARQVGGSLRTTIREIWNSWKGSSDGGGAAGGAPTQGPS
ncbi:hypothetical protein BESB_071310 [Besnoitia besnoiti]|uniref:Uncharacterized protein n=1 Tax=Besnoitia besnoiti TaxID=94643 RepID=A0A2A9M7R9_BESBE|nr:uncharacterized protein BESB_071310 [Besnoitia besnoiti]PFH33979.1 hypothetical protein BESB_071310 [Besnoitia besnoiti]